MQRHTTITLPAKNKAGNPRQRAAIACQSCNGKRIKCNAVSVGLPCSNCSRSGRVCQLIESRRGQKKEKTRSDSQHSPAQKDHRRTASQDLLTPDDRRPSEATALETRGNHEEAEDVELPTETVSVELLDVDNVNSEVQRHKNPPEPLRPQGFNASNAQRDIPTEHCQRPIPLSQTSRSIDFVAQGSHDESLSEVGYANTAETEKEVLDVLEIQHAFDIPKPDVCLQLFRTFFVHVTPSHPVIDRVSFIFQFSIPQRPPSWLLLQAVLFTAAGHCEEDLLKEAGFESRTQARMTLFKRVKALYDADHENDKFTIVQATFLMSLWWESPVDSKNNWHWLNVSINLAVMLGMNRSTRNSGMPIKIQRLWKKLWWSLYTEDKYLSATLGRPARLRSSECTVEDLEMADFDGEQYGFGDSFRVGLPKVIMAYPICLSSLAQIAERIIEQVSKPSNYSPELCDGMLQVWEAGLPEFYQQESTNTIWPSMLRIAACWLRILVYRFHLQIDFPSPARHGGQQRATQAAYQMVRIIEDLLADEKIQACPVHIIPALHAAMSILANTGQTGSSITQRLAHVKYEVCVVALQELQVVWPVSRWILAAFAVE